jgi:hypothetical protein
MWTATIDGFFSAVSKKPYNGQSVERYHVGQTISVRARNVGDIVNLTNRLSESGQFVMADTVTSNNDVSAIVSGGGTDYPFRVFMTPRAWKGYLSLCTEAMEYPNFKNAVKKKSPRHASLYGRVWSVLLHLEG